MYDLRVIVAVVATHQLDIRTCTEILFSSACPNIELLHSTSLTTVNFFISTRVSVPFKSGFGIK